MELSDFFKELIRKTAHRFPKKIKPIYLTARANLEILMKREDQNGSELPDQVIDIILPSIAVYKAVIKVTGDSEKAYDIVSRCFEDYFEEKASKMREASKKALMSHLVPSITADFIKKLYCEKNGFKVINRSKGLKLCHFDIVKCPFFDYCKAYGVEDLTTAFCDVADIAFDHLHRGISWDRTRTLGRGDEKCDFIISVDD